MAKTERPLPDFVQQEFESYLKCGRLEHGFLRVQCQLCKHEDLVAFSCKKRGFCPSCGAKRMVEHAALLVDEILPAAPYRQWVLSVPFQLRFLFASKPEVMSKALGIVYRTIATHLIHTAGHTHDTAHAGAITFIQRFGSALNLNVHLMCRDARMSRAHGCAGATMARLASSTSSMLGPGVRQIRKVEAPKPSQTCMFIARSNENSPQSGLCKSEGRSRPPHFGVATRACPLGRPLRRPQKRASSLTT